MKDKLKIKKPGKVKNAYKKNKPRSIFLNRRQRGDILWGSVYPKNAFYRLGIQEIVVVYPFFVWKLN